MSLYNFLLIDTSNNQKSVEERWDTFVMRFQNYLVAFAITDEASKLEQLFDLAGNDVYELYNTLSHTSPAELQESPVDQAIRVLTAHFNKKTQPVIKAEREKTEIEVSQLSQQPIRSSSNQEGSESIKPSHQTIHCDQEVSESIKSSHQAIQCDQEVSEVVKARYQVFPSNQESSESVKHCNQDNQCQTSHRLRDCRFTNTRPEYGFHQDEKRAQRQQSRRGNRNHSGFLPADFIQYDNDQNNFVNVVNELQVHQSTVTDHINSISEKAAVQPSIRYHLISTTFTNFEQDNSLDQLVHQHRNNQDEQRDQRQFTGIDHSDQNGSPPTESDREQGSQLGIINYQHQHGQLCVIKDQHRHISKLGVIKDQYRVNRQSTVIWSSLHNQSSTSPRNETATAAVKASSMYRPPNATPNSCGDQHDFLKEPTHQQCNSRTRISVDVQSRTSSPTSEDTIPSRERVVITPNVKLKSSKTSSRPAVTLNAVKEQHLTDLSKECERNLNIHYGKNPPKEGTLTNMTHNTAYPIKFVTLISGDQPNTFREPALENNCEQTPNSPFTSSPSKETFLLRKRAITQNVKLISSRQRHQINKAVDAAKPVRAITPNVKMKSSQQRHHVNKAINAIRINEYNISCLLQHFQMSPVIKLLNPAFKKTSRTNLVDSTNSKRGGEREPAVKLNMKRSLEPLRDKVQTNHTEEQSKPCFNFIQ